MDGQHQGLGATLGLVHRGEQLLDISKPTMVFPQAWVQSMERLAYAAEHLAAAPMVNSAPPVIVESRSGQSFTNNYYGDTTQNTRRATYEMAAILGG